MEGVQTSIEGVFDLVGGTIRSVDFPSRKFVVNGCLAGEISISPEQQQRIVNATWEDYYSTADSRTPDMPSRYYLARNLAVPQLLVLDEKRTIVAGTESQLREFSRRYDLPYVRTEELVASIRAGLGLESFRELLR